MMKSSIQILILVIGTLVSNAQEIKKLKADSIISTNDSFKTELIIKNHTKDTAGFLYNKMSGQTEFRRALRKLNDSGSYLIGADTFRIETSGSIHKTPGGANGSIQFNRSNNFDGDSTQLYWDSLTHRFHINGTTPESQLSITKDSLDLSSTETDGIAIINNLSAINGTQQRSPVIRLISQGWKTNSPAGTRPVEVSVHLGPYQGNSIPAYHLEWNQKKANSANWFRFMDLNHAGVNIFGTTSSIGAGGLSLTGTFASARSEILGGEHLNFTTSIATDQVAGTFMSTPNSVLTTGNVKFISLRNGAYGFYPSSGNGTHSLLSLEFTINQTGTANGITRGIWVSPTITSAVDFRAIEVVAGKSTFRSIKLTNAGDKLHAATGTNASFGTATLSSGTVTINTTAITASSLVFVNYVTPSGTTGQLSSPSASIAAGTSFVINSSAGADNSTVYYWIVN